MMPWDRNRPESKSGLGTRHIAPDYSSRAAQFRLFLLVAVLMTVLIAMNEARKPATWAWLWKGEKGAVEKERIDSRIVAQSNAAGESPTIVAPLDAVAQPSPLLAAPITNGVSAPRDDESREAWRRVVESLAADERIELERLLRAAARRQTPTADESLRWDVLTQRLESLWRRMLDEQNRAALLPDSALPTEHRQATLRRLTELELDWTKRQQPAMAAVAAGKQSDEHLAVLAKLRQTLDANALSAIRDDTVWRHEERSAWFRLIERLQSNDVAANPARVGFVQIFRQPHEYRGQLVTTRGTVEMAYRVAAPGNDLGVTEYCLLWLRPEDGTNLPIVVYALQPPMGFPPITSTPTKFREPVEVTGFFFKRWVYRAADGLNSVPLILVKAPRWEPQLVADRSRFQKLADDGGWPFWCGVIAMIVAAGGGLVWLMAWSTRAGRATSRVRSPTDDEHVSWDQLSAAPSVREQLSQLEKKP